MRCRQQGRIDEKKLWWLEGDDVSWYKEWIDRWKMVILNDEAKEQIRML
jgi:hypothetical protein